jgi:hypothetical protein
MIVDENTILEWQKHFGIGSEEDRLAETCAALWKVIRLLEAAEKERRRIEPKGINFTFDLLDWIQKDYGAAICAFMELHLKR